MQSPWLREVSHRRVQVPDPVVVSDRVDMLSYASILINVGFGNPAGVAQAVAQWRAIHEQVRPDRIVLDTAPMAQLAACLYRWPAIRISNGFDCPPASCPSFGIGMRGPYVERLNAAHVVKAEAGLSGAAAMLGSDIAPTLADYLTYPRRYFDCIPDTDPYGARDDVTYIGPLNALPGREPPKWPESGTTGGPRVFAYLRGGPLARPLLNALGDIGARVLCVSTGQPPDIPAAHNGHMHVTRSPLDLSAAAREADLVVSYAPLGLLTQACIAGAPQLLAPTDTEKMLASRRVMAAGRAVVVRRAAGLTQALGAARRIAIAPPRWGGAPTGWLDAALG
jgi:UDP:flavonoid glycosyltransferase YjiC (YdhE family)